MKKRPAKAQKIYVARHEVERSEDGRQFPGYGLRYPEENDKTHPRIFYMISEIDLNKLFAESMSFEI